MKLSVIIPAFNEEANVQVASKGVYNILKNLNMAHEIIAVDDGSTDGTWKELQIAAREIKILRLIRCEKNCGKGQALKLGFEASSGEFVAFIDAGLEIHPKHLLDFLKLMKKSGADVVIGSKFHPESKIEYPTRRLFFSALHNLAVKLLLRLPIRDTQVGLKLFKREVLEEVCPLLLVKRYAFDVELLVNVKRRGYKICEAPITLHFKSEFEKMVFKDVFKIALDVLAIFYRTHLLRYYDRMARCKK